MAATNTLGVIATAISSGGINNKQNQGFIDSRNKSMFDTYVTLGTEGVGSTIKMCAPIPAGAYIRNVTLINPALGGSTTISVGDSNSATRYLNAQSTSSAGKNSATLNTAIGYQIGTNTGDNQILLTTGGATLTVALTIMVIIDYAFD